MTCQTALLSFKAYPVHGFRTEFGLCRGERMHRLDDLNPGEIYQIRHDAPCSDVSAAGDASVFYRIKAANLPLEILTTCARLIFMTTTGRRVDMQAALCHGQLHLVSETPLQTGTEYVLIEKTPVENPQAPALVPAASERCAPRRSNVIPLRAIG
ncbi:hypothetical protein [Marivita sp. GX14005]|uniref:hypothetical protein n=1 Tax=Marivita sp. GX14005 TaxID=2942276 RepID=UPI0020190E55|nr:hypothetical protein [Marivita sp. GX14005]MCL3882740.1 hypothetical protein [Marivita sp. GX14005]